MSDFAETLAEKIAWLLEGGTTLDVAEYLISSNAVADPAEVARLRAQVAEVKRALLQGGQTAAIRNRSAAGLLVTPDDDYAARWDADAQAIKGTGA